MKKSVSVLLLLILALLAVYFFWKKEPVQHEPSLLRGLVAQDAASEMLRFLPYYADSKAFARMGFKTLEEVKLAELGEPVTRLLLRCDSIFAYTPSKGESLEPLTMWKQKVFPIVVGDVARSTILVDSFPDTTGKSKLPWDAFEVGHGDLAIVIDKGLKEQATQSGVPISKYQVVEIPSINRTYFHYTTPAGAFFSQAYLDTSACWPGKAGESLRASAVLSALATCPDLLKVIGNTGFRKADALGHVEESSRSETQVTSK